MITHWDPRIIASMAFLLFALVSFMRAQFNVQVDMATLMVPTIVQGAAVACFFIPLVSITLSGLPQDRIASASGLSNFVRITAGAFGTSISTTLWENRATMHHAHLTESINSGNLAATQTLDSLQASGMSAAQALGNLDRIINAQAYVLSADDVFYASAIIFLFLLPLIWLTRRTRSAADAGGAH
jgi:DHA2 family multidrug resistance protein